MNDIINPIDNLVCVRCFTFNQASYIEDAMNGFCMQQTHFPFVCVIVDDASIDGESAVINNYLHCHFDMGGKWGYCKETDDYLMTFSRHKENRNCYFAVYYLKYNHKRINKSKFSYFSEYYKDAKYHAICEGDDYWIDPLKLQKQIEFLEEHPDYTMVFHNAFEIWEGQTCTKDQKLFSDIQNRDYTGAEIFKDFIVPTASALFKTDIYFSDKYQQTDSNNQIIVGDLPTWLSCEYYGKVRGMSDVMSVYRRNPSSWTCQMSISKHIKMVNMCMVLSEIFDNQYKDIARRMYIDGMLRTLALPLKDKGDFLLKCKVCLSLLKGYPVRTAWVLVGLVVKRINKIVS